MAEAAQTECRRDLEPLGNVLHSDERGCVEHDRVATAGDFAYETPGQAHALIAYEPATPMKLHVRVRRPLVRLDHIDAPAR